MRQLFPLDPDFDGDSASGRCFLVERLLLLLTSSSSDQDLRYDPLGQALQHIKELQLFLYSRARDEADYRVRYFENVDWIVLCILLRLR